MKKILFALLVIIWMVYPAFSFDASQGSAQLTSDGAAATGSNLYISGVTIMTDGTNDATAVIYDNASAASGTVIAQLYCPGALKSDRMVWTFPRKVNNGIYVDLTGTGASTVVDYLRK